MYRRSIFLYNFIYFLPHWSLLLCAGFSLVAASSGYLRGGERWLSSWGVGLPLLQTGSRSAGFSGRARRLSSAVSVAVDHRLSCFAACGIFPGQGLNSGPCIGRRILTSYITGEGPHSCFYMFFSILVYHRILKSFLTLLNSRTLLLFHPVSNSLRELPPDSQSFLPSQMLRLGFPAPASEPTHKSLFCKLGELLSLPQACNPHPLNGNNFTYLKP